MANTTEPLYPRPTNQTGVTEFLFQYPNEHLIDGVMGISIMLTLFVLIFAPQARRNPRKGYAAAAFVTFVAATLMAGLGIAGPLEWTLGLVLAVTGVIVAKDSRGVV